MEDSQNNPVINEVGSSGPTFAHFAGVSTEFEALQLIAERGHTQLWKARRFSRWHMLKCLKPSLAADVAHQQLLVKEMNALMRVNNQGVVQGYGMEPVEGVGVCIIMEYVEGDTLSQWLEKPHDMSEYERVMSLLLNAVEAIHAAGLVHRDIKPSNVMITRLGSNVKIIDFGFADSDSDALFKQPAGTPGYVSPEQSTGNVPDVRNDIYSLGALMEQIPALKRRYGNVINKCLGEIDKRYSSVGELRAAMQAVNSRRKAMWWSIAAAAIIAILVAAVLWNYRQPAATLATARHDSVADTTAIALPLVVDTAAPPHEETAAPQVGNKELAAPKGGDNAQDYSKEVNNAIDEGERILRQQFDAPELMRFLDNIKPGDNPFCDELFASLVGYKKALEPYLNTIRGNFTKSQMAVIENSLNMTHNRLLIDINERAAQKSK